MLMRLAPSRKRVPTEMIGKATLSSPKTTMMVLALKCKCARGASWCNYGIGGITSLSSQASGDGSPHGQPYASDEPNPVGDNAGPHQPQRSREVDEPSVTTMSERWKESGSRHTRVVLGDFAENVGLR